MTNEVRSFEGKLEALKDAIKKYMNVRTSMANSSTCIIGKLEALGKCEESHVQERAAEVKIIESFRKAFWFSRSFMRE